MWAAGVCLTAYCTIPAADQADHFAKKHAPKQHVNPWALEPKG